MICTSHRPWVLVVAQNGQATIWLEEYELQTVGSRLYPTLRTNPLDLHNKDIEHHINRLQLGNHCGLLHETKGNVLCA